MKTAGVHVASAVFFLLQGEKHTRNWKRCFTFDKTGVEDS